MLPFFGGYLVDKFNARNCLVLYAFLILVGNIIFAVGMESKLWGVMYLGRILHGCGGISICVATLSLLAEWFTGKELALAFGFNLSFCRMGGVMSNLVNPRVVDETDVVTALWLGVIMCALSFLCAAAIVPMDIFVEKRLSISHVQSLIEPDVAVNFKKLDGTANPIHVGSTKSPMKAQAFPEAPPSRLQSVRNISPLFWLLCISCMSVYGCVFPFNNIASTLLMERNYFMEQPNSQCALSDDNPGSCQNATNVPNEYCNDGKWYQPPVAQGANVDCTASPACYSIYCDDLERSELQAATVMSIPYIITAVLCPFFGALVDRYGQRATVLTLAPALLLLVHMAVAFSDISIIILLCGQGFAYCAFAAVLWPSISLVLEPQYYGLGRFTYVDVCVGCYSYKFAL